MAPSMSKSTSNIQLFPATYRKMSLSAYQKRTYPLLQQSSSSSSLYSASRDDDESLSSSSPAVVKDELIRQTALGLKRLSWFSWWCQVILTTISSVTLLFAKNVRKAGAAGDGLGGLFLAGSGITLSILSIFWTWGGARLARRLVRRTQTTRISAANMTRRAVSIAVTINLVGMFVTILGAEQIVGSLAARILSSSGLSPFAATSANLVAQTIQPLDVLVVQANTNTLLSHYISLACALSLKKFISRLDPPSTEEKRRLRIK